MYTGDMPRITSLERIERLDPVDVARVQLTPAEAVASGNVDRPPARATLLTVLGRPAYRFDGVTVFADTGERLAPIGSAAAKTAALRFLGEPASAVTYDRLLIEAATLAVRKAPFDTGALYYASVQPGRTMALQRPAQPRLCLLVQSAAAVGYRRDPPESRRHCVEGDWALGRRPTDTPRCCAMAGAGVT